VDYVEYYHAEGQELVQPGGRDVHHLAELLAPHGVFAVFQNRRDIPVAQVVKNRRQRYTSPL